MLINLLNGNLDLNKRVIPEFPLQKYYQKECDILKKKLDNSLSEDGQKLLDELLDTNACESQYGNYDSFISGFRVATLLMVEVFHDKDNLLENREQHLRHLLHRPYRGTPSVMDDFAENE